MTLEAPTTPVVIYDWPNRSKYVFDARSLARDFRNRLTHHDQLFLEPKVPRNPFTNAHLTFGQLHFTLNALRLTGQMDWTLEAYRSVAYDIGELHKRYKHALSLDALHRLFANPTSEDCVDLIFDFIYSEHENHDATMQRQDVWLWFLRNQPTYPRIQMWRSWCHAYYKAYLTETATKFQTIVDGIRTETAELVDQPMSDMLARWRLEMTGAKTSSLPPAGEGDADADDL